MTNNDLFYSDTQYKVLLNKIIRLPVWVKQALCYELKVDLAECSDIKVLDSKETKIIQLFVPRLTAKAHYLIKESKLIGSIPLTSNQIAFIHCVKDELNMLEIAHKNKWSLVNCCIVLFELIEKSLIEDFSDSTNINLINYLTGKIRLGEYLVRTGRLTSIQLDQALYSKKCAEKLGEQVEFTDILVNMGYIKSGEAEGIKQMKNSATLPVLQIDDSLQKSEEIIMLQDQINSLKGEIESLKEEANQLRQELHSQIEENMNLVKQQEKNSKNFVKKLLTFS